LFLHVGMSGLGLLGVAVLGATPAYASLDTDPVLDELDTYGLLQANPQLDEQPWATEGQEDINSTPVSDGVRVEELDSAIALDEDIPSDEDILQVDNMEDSLGLESVISLETIAEGSPMAQVTSVNQLSDVKPTDWAFQALQSLIERYGCIAGYPNGTFQGHQSISRYEFAAGLNACLEGLALGTSGSDDLAIVERLQTEFANELASLRDQVDALETQIALLESQQFSTTTRLFGQLVVGVQGRTDNRADFFPVDGVQDTDDPSTQLNLITNAQLSLLTQFNPNSLLLIGMQGGSGSTAPRLTNDTRLSYEGNTNNDLQLSDLTYRQLIGDDFAIIVGPRGVNAVNVFRGANRVESAGFGPLSAFAQRNPVISVGGGDTGVGFDWQVAPWMSVQGVYSTSNGPDPARGLFGGDFGDTVIGTQLTFVPIDTIDIALNYVNAYTRSGNLRNSIGDS
ncbi:MAG TPA: iron uptake porin, partial [Candidatus Obscuribacterales bacterium]